MVLGGGFVFLTQRTQRLGKGDRNNVVFSYDESTDTGYVVTAYIPDPNLWQDGFRIRR